MKAIEWSSQALIASSWEICLLGVVLALLLTFIKEAKIRYALAMCALALCLLLPAATPAFRLAESSPIRQRAAIAASASPITAAAKPGKRILRPVLRTDEPTPPQPEPRDRSSMLVWLWLAGCLLMSIRLVAGWFGLHNLRARTSLAGREWQLLIANVSKRMGLRSVPELRVGGSDVSACAAGLWRPVVFVPSALLGLSPEIVEAAIAHEAAHLLRNDYLANIVQVVIESTLYYHPVVWLIGRAARREREHCCDDLAVRYLGSRRGYVHALAGLAELKLKGQPSPALGITRSSLVERVSRILGRDTSTRIPWWTAVCLLCTIGGGIALIYRTSSAQAQSVSNRGGLRINVAALDADGKPLQVMLALQKVGGSSQEAETDENGRAFFNLEPGDYEFGLSDLVKIYPTGSGRFLQGAGRLFFDSPSHWVLTADGKFRASWAKRVSADFVNGYWDVRFPEVLIRGQVLGPDGSPVRLQGRESRQVDMTVPKLYLGDDSYSVNGAATAFVDHHQGRFELLVQKRSLVNPRFVFSMPGFAADENAKIVNGSVTLRLHAVGKAWLVGKVVDDQGRPIRSANVSLIANGDSKSMGMLEIPRDSLKKGMGPWVTDANGSYQFKFVNPGETLRVLFKGSKGLADAEVQVKVTPGENVVPAIRAIKANRSISGRVIDSDGRPVAGARVRCWLSEEQVETKTDSGGRFVLRGLPSEGALQISADKGYMDSWNNQEGHDGMVIKLHPSSRVRAR
jgi:beta-lactamase regulating signal transducer with metallopeptidase domain